MFPGSKMSPNEKPHRRLCYCRKGSERQGQGQGQAGLADENTGLMVSPRPHAVLKLHKLEVHSFTCDVEQTGSQLPTCLQQRANLCFLVISGEDDAHPQFDLAVLRPASIAYVS